MNLHFSIRSQFPTNLVSLKYNGTMSLYINSDFRPNIGNADSRIHYIYGTINTGDVYEETKGQK